MRQSIFRSGKLKRNLPLVWAVAGGVLMVFIPFMVPALRNLLGIVPLSFGEWVLVFGVAFALSSIVEIGKLIRRRSYRKQPAIGER